MSDQFLLYDRKWNYFLLKLDIKCEVELTKKSTVERNLYNRKECNSIKNVSAFAVDVVLLRSKLFPYRPPFLKGFGLQESQHEVTNAFLLWETGRKRTKSNMWIVLIAETLLSNSASFACVGKLRKPRSHSSEQCSWSGFFTVYHIVRTCWPFALDISSDFVW